MDTTATIIAVVSWFALGQEPSNLTLLQGGETCPGLSLHFYNTPVHDTDDEAVPRHLDAGPYGTITIRVRFAAAQHSGFPEHEGIYLEPGSPWVMRDPGTWEVVPILLVDEHEEGTACLELPMG